MIDFVFDYAKADRMRKNFDIILNNIKTDNRDVYILGAGKYAQGLRDFLFSKQINVKGFVVDDEYIHRTTIDSLLPFSDILKSNNFDLIFGICCGFTDWFDIKTKEINNAVSQCPNSKFYVFSDYWMIDQGLIYHDVIDSVFLKNHISEFKETFNILEDDLSRETMIEYLYASIGRDASSLSNLWSDDKNDYDLNLLFNDCKCGVVIDCGAFDGKSIVQMSEYLKDSFQMIALECDEENYIKCCERISSHPNIKAINYGVWDKRTKLGVSQSADQSYLVEVNDDNYVGNTVEVTDIDSLIGSNSVAALIMDIEGSELKALNGAKKTIESGANLAVRVYHKKEDLITIPQFIKSINSSYHFYLRFNKGASLCRTGVETTLYAIMR